MVINGIKSEFTDSSRETPKQTDLIAQMVGKRKCSTAIASIYRGSGDIVINGLPLDEYFQKNLELLNDITKPFNLLNIEGGYDVILKVKGGGLKGQAQAIRLAIAKIFASFSLEKRQILKKEGLLTRDARVKERKKYGLKKARKASQFSKR